MALVSYSCASSECESSESDSEGADGDNPRFFFPFKNSENLLEFSEEIVTPSETTHPILDPQNTQDAVTPLFARPEFRHDFNQPKTEKILSDAAAHIETNGGLNSAELYKLCGSQAKRFSANEIDLIEIDGSSFVNDQPNVRLNDPADEHAFCNKKFKSSRLEKSKHQITFLAEHAKLHEREINLVRANRFHNRRKTQGKYGF